MTVLKAHSQINHECQTVLLVWCVVSFCYTGSLQEKAKNREVKQGGRSRAGNEMFFGTYAGIPYFDLIRLHPNYVASTSAKREFPIRECVRRKEGRGGVGESWLCQQCSIRHPGRVKYEGLWPNIFALGGTIFNNKSYSVSWEILKMKFGISHSVKWCYSSMPTWFHLYL